MARSIKSEPVPLPRGPRQQTTTVKYKPLCCGLVTYKGGALIVGVLETVYWFYFLFLLIFSAIHHGHWWSLTVSGLSLLITGIQIAFLFYGILLNNPLFIQIHLIYLVLVIVWNFIMCIGMVALLVAPFPRVTFYLDHSGHEYGTRVFALVMLILLLLFVMIRIFMIVIVYRYWRIVKWQKYGQIATAV